ncbi:unnamed protein product [Rotaria sp. Silwood1]|nr:unnamed protein product [Rotaria sp. Silwood1]CAF1639967.1 unnamed protein product [Rotaria sp. Silwood1]CAF3790370.1 unnamed protein product [Rotaria sp. Silwood1]CAF3813779.1 unnamed protein product [Rotaria sp. Silwood1]CAF3874902.1 unnamed protein product [Rotaria sp. Silwood1]
MNRELEQTSSDNIRKCIRLLNTIATFHMRELNYEIAKKVFDDAISLYNQYQEVTLTKDEVLENLMIAVYFNLARLHYRQEAWTIALKIFQKSLNMVFEQDQQHPQLAEIYNCLELTYAHRKDCLKAKHYHRLAVKLAEKILPYGHPDLQRYQYQLEITLLQLNRLGIQHSL